MNITLTNMRRIEDENLYLFNFKEEISDVEYYGMEYILEQLYIEFCENYLGVEASSSIKDIFTHRGNCLDILDGYSDLLVVGDYGIVSARVTDNGILVFECKEYTEDFLPVDNSTYYVSLN